MAAGAYRPAALSAVPREAWPRHVAIIMDGNGRWARRRGLPRLEGHRRGAISARRVAEESSRLELEQLTLFAFSSENWNRPKGEVSALMELYRQHLVKVRSVFKEHNFRFQTIGRRDRIPPKTLAELERTIEIASKNTGPVLCLAVDYGGRQEILGAARRLAERVRDGELGSEEITEEVFGGALDTAGMRDPDLLIRTAGEMRVSNFLLWQISYAELWVTEKCWPEFNETDLHAGMAAYAGRERRFGRVADASTEASEDA